MRRRDFIALASGAVAWPLTARAQRPKLATIGVLVVANPEPFWSQLREALRGLGYIEGQNIVFEFRSAEGKPNLLPNLAAELVQLKVDIIVASQTPAVLAAKQTTSEIPIVMAPAGDPVATGLVASLARPGGNVTGLSTMVPDLAAKMVELIREVLAPAQRVAVLANVADPFTKPFLLQIELAGRAAQIEIRPIMVAGIEEYDAAFSAMMREIVDAVIVQPSLPSKRAVDLSLKNRLPALSFGQWFAGEGGLMSYSGTASAEERGRQIAAYVDKILKGTKPADIPVEQPTKFELVINLRTAKVLGLTIPPSLLARADEVIE